MEDDTFKTSCTPAEREPGCSPRQMAVRDALIMMGGVPVQQVYQMSSSNLQTLEREEKLQNFTVHPSNSFPAFSLKVTFDTLLNMSECESVVVSAGN